jgi:hypothetical protein
MAHEWKPPVFWNWFSYPLYGSGQVQVSVSDSGTSTWSAWTAVDTAVSGSSSIWSLKAVDLTAYAGQRIRVAFLHNGEVSVSTGWYIDSIGFVQL